MNKKALKLDPQFGTKAIHGSFHYDKVTGAVMPPIYLSTTYAQKAPGEPISKYEYSRTANPTRDILESTLAALEGGNYCLAFSSGCAALSTLLQAFPSPYHVVLSNDVYGGTMRLFSQVFSQLGITFTQCDMTKPEQIIKAITAQTRFIWLETPSNPLLQIIDIAHVNELRKQHAPEVLLAVDNTFATPYLQNPLDLGADIVCHSTTKYIGGHSDILGGALILNDDALAQKLSFLQNAVGSVPSPMDCYLLLRSVKTLHVRMSAHCDNAKIIAEYLSHHPRVKKVIYPGLSHHPQHELVTKQMRDYGAMVSVVLNGNTEDVLQFLQRLQIFTLAESLGAVESLIEHPATMTHAAIPASHRQKIGIEDTLVRISVGIEDPQDLIEDLEQALS
ncbi:MAG: cystathionine gamma-synthase [Gammaproteobacteria bacterium 39-13]|nr:PLP-dependent transferase [Gammaproteobacteria bacterium]OJV90295.1 MAG: cystathionine gamma-synthase [Gammaproteobacteria bacterium 39-13]